MIPGPPIALSHVYTHTHSSSFNPRYTIHICLSNFGFFHSTYGHFGRYSLLIYLTVVHQIPEESELHGGVFVHFQHLSWYLAHCRMCVCMCSVASVVSSCATHGLETRRLLCPWDSPGKNTGVGCHVLLQGTFQIQGLNQHLLHLLHCKQILYHWAKREAHTVGYSSNMCGKEE